MTDSPIKVLIADDESIVRRGLMATVNWERFNMAVVADAPNGQKAWEAFLLHEPEVVITDIVMPEMDGIELAKRIKEKAPQTRVLLLSCHRDFEYAQKGMMLGASGYLLKTAFEDEELAYYLHKFEEELAGDQQSSPLVRSADSSEEDTQWNAAFYAWLCGFRNDFHHELKLRWETQWSWLNEPHEIMLVKIFDSFEQVPSAGKASNRGGEYWKYLGDTLLHETKGPCSYIPCGIDRCFYVYHPSAWMKVEQLLKECKSSCPQLHWSRRGPLKGMEGWLEAVQELHRAAEVERKFELRVNSWPETVMQSVLLVADNVSEPWSVSDVANRVGLSRSHFSTLFKKVTGENFVTFLYRMRLKTAQDLLLNTAMTLQDIAERIGMVDGKYVSKWFKRCCGMTPSQYRSGQKGEQTAQK
ncbi:response regulator [Paenibacillus sp. S-12]|uniref:response regulator transcription factor n=1 Tax=unclassified Paenibacillus TaxID=185978 RepID=UPI0025A077F4|nr:response regulator [Paenibacillus sp. S-12]